MRTKAIRALVVNVGLAILLLGLAACQGQPGAAPATTQAPPTAATTQVAPTTAAPAPAQTTAAAPTSAVAPATTAALIPLKVGMLQSLTGPIVRIAVSSGRFAQLAVDDINAKGGVKVGDKTFRFETVSADSKYTSEGGRAGADRLALAEKVKIIFNDSSTVTAGAQAVTEPNKVLLLSSSAVDPSLGSAHPLTVQLGSVHNRMRIPALYDWLRKTQPQAKNIAVIAADDVSGKTSVSLAQGLATAKGLNVVATELFATDIKDFGPLFTRVLRSGNVDAIDISQTGASAPIFTALMKSLNEQGFRKPVLGHGLNAGAMKELGAAAENYVFSVLADWKAPVVTEREKQVIQAYINKYGEGELELMTVGSYNPFLVLAQAMTKAGTVDDTEKLASVLREGTWDTLFGPAKFVGAKTFGAPAVLETVVYVGTAKGGNLVTIDRLKGTMD